MLFRSWIMKKLVSAFAVCMLAGFVSAQVESQNIVGYQTIDLPIGYKMMTSTFVPVGSAGEVLRLRDITPSNFDGDTVQFFNLNGNGAIVTTATYYAGYGWADAYNVEIMLDDMTIPVGTGMFVSSTQAGAQFLVAGEVALSSFQLAAATGYTVVGNSSPVAITLADIVPTNFDGDTAQFFNPNGNGTVVMTATYYAGYGWADAYNVETMLDDTVLDPGVAFFAACTQAGATFTFPGIVL